MRGLLRGLVAVVALALSARATERALDLEDWIESMRLVPDVKYRTTIAGTKVTVDDIRCEDLRVGGVAATYVPPRSLRLELSDVRASCDGDYEWKYETRFRGVEVATGPARKSFISPKTGGSATSRATASSTRSSGTRPWPSSSTLAPTRAARRRG